MLVKRAKFVVFEILAFEIQSGFASYKSFMTNSPPTQAPHFHTSSHCFPRIPKCTSHDVADSCVIEREMDEL